MGTKGINKVILVGNLGQDPEVRYTSNGNPVTSLSIATSESWKDKQGQPQERTEWHRVAMFGKLAEIAGEYLRKGSQVYLEGKLQTRKWEQDGQDRYTTEVVVDQSGTMQMLGSKADSSNNAQKRPQQQNGQNAPTDTQQALKTHQGAKQPPPQEGIQWADDPDNW